MEADKNLILLIHIFNYRHESQGRLSSNILRRPQKIWQNLPLCFDVTKYAISKKVGYFFTLCGPLTISEF